MCLAFRLFFYQSTRFEPNLDDPFADKTEVSKPPLPVDIRKPHIAVDIAVDIPKPTLSADGPQPEEVEAPKNGNQIRLP